MSRNIVKLTLGLLVAAMATCSGGVASERAGRPMLYGSVSSGNLSTGSSVGHHHLSAAELGLLARRDIVLIVDKSSSMSSKDCPSNNSSKNLDASATAFEWIAAHMVNPVSRWDWCREQLASLSNQLDGISNEGFTLILFDSKYTVHDHLRAAQVINLFRQHEPGGRTNLAPALNSQLASYKARCWGGLKSKPLLVAVLTDGYAKDAEEVRGTIINATTQLRSPDEIKLLFVNVGMQQKGSELLQDLDHSLVSKGAKFDIVQTTTFTKIAQHGLARTLASAAMTPCR